MNIFLFYKADKENFIEIQVTLHKNNTDVVLKHNRSSTHAMHMLYCCPSSSFCWRNMINQYYYTSPETSLCKSNEYLDLLEAMIHDDR